MASTAQEGTEFWRDLKPIAKVFQTDAKPGGLPARRAHRRRALLRAVLRHGVVAAAVDLAGAEPLVRHPDGQGAPGWSTATTTRTRSSPTRSPGKWSYLEHDWVATAGDFVYETPGEAHTLVAHEHAEPMKVHFNVNGPADLAGRGRRARGLLRRPPLHRPLPRALRRGRDRGRLRGRAVPVIPTPSQTVGPFFNIGLPGDQAELVDAGADGAVGSRAWSTTARASRWWTRWWRSGRPTPAGATTTPTTRATTCPCRRASAASAAPRPTPTTARTRS